jgi:hypothetical protein
MLTDTLVLGTSGNLLTYSKQFGDAQSGSRYSVAGLGLTTASNLAIQNRVEKSGVTRRLIDLSTNVPVPDSTNGAYTTRRVYLNIVQGPNDSATDIKADIERIKTIVDDTALQDQILNGEL